MKTRRKDFNKLSKLLYNTKLGFWDGSISTTAFTTGTEPCCAGTAAITVASNNALITFISLSSGVFFNEFLTMVHVVALVVEDLMG